jgi:hypothetical protein
MSQLQVNRINDASGGVLAPISSVMRNRLINSDMRIDQRNAGASVSLVSGGGNTFSADRWYVENATDGTATIQQITDAPTGFSNSIRYTVTATDTSLASDQAAFIQQRIEGFNFADMLYGTANAKTVTVSFWVKSSVTGTFGVALANSAYNRGYPASFTVLAANTWEQKSVTITGDTTGTWVGSTNGIGVRVSFGMAAGSARASASGAWAAATVLGVNSQVNLMATNGATFQVSGVQLEVGTQATSFEYRQYGTELALCQRYTKVYSAGSTNTRFALCGPFAGNLAYPSVFLPVTLRSTPSLTFSAVGDFKAEQLNAGTTQVVTALGIDNSSIDEVGYSVQAGSSFTNAVNLLSNNANAKIIISAEL